MGTWGAGGGVLGRRRRCARAGFAVRGGARRQLRGCAARVFHVKHDVYRVAVDAGEWQCMLKAGRPEVDRLETRLVRNEPVINELAGVRRSMAEV